MKRNSRAVALYIGIHVAIPLLCLVAQLVTEVVLKTPNRLLSGCWIHDLLHLYCPLCGGTRAAGAIARFDFLEAFRYNAAVVIFLIVMLAWDVVAFVRLLQKKSRWWSFPRKFWLYMVWLFVGYTILRNLLVMVWGIDPVGDLAAFWI